MKNSKITFKRLFLVAVILAMFVCFASCGGSEKPAESDQAASGQTAAATGESAPVQQVQTVETVPAQQAQPTESVPVQNTDTGSAVPVEQPPAAQTQSVTEPTYTADNVLPVAAPVAETNSPAETVTVTGGNCAVDIISAGLDVDYTGSQVIVVKFKFTNNSNTSACFGDVVMVDVKQNGKTLNGDGIIMDSSSFGGLSFNFRTPVSNGGSVTCVYAYPYSSSDNIDVSVRIVTDDNARTTLGSGNTTLSIG